MPEDHFKTYREHTEIKHSILKDYLGAWVPILGSFNKKIAYIDGFCGPGSYEDKGKTYDGSPVIALKLAKDFSDKVEVLCIFIDKEKDYCEELENRIDELGFKTKHNIVCDEFEEVLSDLLDSVDKIVPAFCFIDPFGYSGMPLQLIKRFLKRPRTEAFINFMYDPISRFISVDHQFDHMDELFGTGEWREVIDQDLRGDDRETFLRDLYHEQLKECAEYVWPFQLKDSDKDRTIYYLFHCTNHAKGIRVMKSIMYKTGTRGTYSYRGREHSQASLFSTEPDINELEQFLLDEFAGQRASFDYIVDSTYDSPFIDKDYRRVLNDLRKAGIIQKIPKTTKGERGFNKNDIAIFPEKSKKRKKLKGFDLIN